MKVRATAGGVLVAIAALIVAVSFLAVYGDTFASHVGMTRDSAGRLAVRIALCPGEQVRSVEVATESAPRQSWRVTGPGSPAATWVVGAAKAGYPDRVGAASFLQHAGGARDGGEGFHERPRW